MSPCPVDLFFFKKRTKRNIEFFFVPPLTLDRKKKQAGGFSISFFRVWLFYFNPNNGTQRERLLCFFFKRKKLSFTFTCKNIVYLEIKTNSFPFTGGIIR